MDKRYPEAVVGCFILNNQHELILVRSYKWPNHWVVMGGHIEWGESIAAAAEREVMEEVGLKVKFVRVIEPAEFIFSPDFHDKKHMIGLQSECKLVGDPTPKIDHDEIQEARWFPLTEASSMADLLPITQHTIKLLLSHHSQ